VAIDEYNHAKGYVDLANQLRVNLDLQIKGDKRTWRPLAYWLFSTCLVNSYLIWLRYQPQDALASHRTHETFTNRLIEQLLRQRTPSLTPPLSPRRTRRMTNHRPSHMGKRGFCAWGLLHPTECLSGAVLALREPRKALEELSGNRRRLDTRKRPKRIRFGCKLCQVHLCVKEKCWDKFHGII